MLHIKLMGSDYLLVTPSDNTTTRLSAVTDNLVSHN